MRKLISNISFLFLFTLAAVAHGASVTVNTTQDEWMNGSNCSLREAVESSNTGSPVDGCAATADGAGPVDTVIVPASADPYILDIPWNNPLNNDNQNGDIDICSSVTIQGAGAETTVIRAEFPANNPDRVFNTLFFCPNAGGFTNGPVGPTTVTIDGVTIENGTVGVVSDVTLGGGGIYNQGDVTLNVSNSIIQNNGGDNTGQNQEFVLGGGILNEGLLTVTASNIQNNTISVVDPQGGQEAIGGGIANRQPAIIMTGISPNGDNTAQGNLCGPAIIQTTNINGNMVNDGYGGGIFVENCPLLVLQSAVYDNHVMGLESGELIGSGGGIVSLQRLLPEGITQVVDSTISGNTAVQNGGGFYEESQEGSSQHSSSTVAFNTADADGDGMGNGGGWFLTRSASDMRFTTQNTIVSNNTAAQGNDCFTVPGDTPPLSVWSADYNLINDQTGCSIMGTTTNDQPAGTDPMLGALMNNGGLTPTHALLLGSPAIDMGNDVAGCTDDIDFTGMVPIAAGAVLGFDQRDDPFLRTVAGVIGDTPRCDIGAYEFSPTEITTDKTASSGFVSIGENFTYTITVTNIGPGMATGVMINDPLPAEVGFVSFGTISQGTCNEAGNVITCDIGTLLPSEVATVEINVVALANGMPVNVATVTTNETEPQNPDAQITISGQVCVTGSGNPFDTVRTGCGNCSLKRGVVASGFWQDWAPFAALAILGIFAVALRRQGRS